MLCIYRAAQDHLVPEVECLAGERPADNLPLPGFKEEVKQNLRMARTVRFIAFNLQLAGSQAVSLKDSLF